MKRTLITFVALAYATTAYAADVAPNDVVFQDGAIAQSLTGVAGNIDNGRVVMNKGAGNCIACHNVTAMKNVPFHGEIGPPLDGAADRWTEAELRGIVANAKFTFEDTMMPAFYKTSGFIRPGKGFTGKAGQEPLAPMLNGQQIEDVVAFLLTMSE